VCSCYEILVMLASSQISLTGRTGVILLVCTRPSSNKYKILPRFMCDYRRAMDWSVDLLTTYMRHSELQVIIELSLFHTIYRSLEHTKSSHSAFTHRFLITDLNNGGPSYSVFTSLLTGEYPTTELTLHSLPCRTKLSTNN
jgi:hypothetical protein